MTRKMCDVRVNDILYASNSLNPFQLLSRHFNMVFPLYITLSLGLQSEKKLVLYNPCPKEGATEAPNDQETYPRSHVPWHHHSTCNLVPQLGCLSQRMGNAGVQALSTHIPAISCIFVLVRFASAAAAW